MVLTLDLQLLGVIGWILIAFFAPVGLIIMLFDSRVWIPIGPRVKKPRRKTTEEEEKMKTAEPTKRLYEQEILHYQPWYESYKRAWNYVPSYWAMIVMSFLAEGLFAAGGYMYWERYQVDVAPFNLGPNPITRTQYEVSVISLIASVLLYKIWAPFFWSGRLRMLMVSIFIIFLSFGGAVTA